MRSWTGSREYVSAAGDTRSRSRSEQAEARRQQIVEAALNLFAQHGFAATSTKRIAGEVGVTEGLIFHYFPTKAALLHEVASQRSTFTSEVQELLAAAVDRPATEVLQGIVLGWVEVMQRQADLVTMLITESQTNEDVGEAFRSVITATVGAMAEYLASRVRAGELRADLPVRASAMMFFSSLMFFFLSNRDRGADGWRQRATVFTREMLDTWFKGAMPGAA